MRLRSRASINEAWRVADMRYFETHEQIYARRLAAGAAGWDDGDYDEFALRDQLQRWLVASAAATQGARVLELGCGTGALACMLAEHGFEVTAIDVSASAIAFARSVAQARGLAVRFEVGNACSWAAPAEAFDVIVDSHLLHCIVNPVERRQLLANLRAALRPEGEFWTETMALSQRFAPTARRRIDPRGIVWERIDEAADCTDTVREDGATWLPSRYIAPSAHDLLSEFADAGFTPLDWRLAIPPRDGESADFRARFRRQPAGVARPAPS
jgi:2-polyprenyl-3-methyl-5-hydroxy-6-metoxy-1,4-benzoquinol methylase